ncbi:MAG TPA: hypothetical protein VE200_16295 [Xanthobacteraceae bacterium]|jgi:hypothetical protein|nr:hypothetical protein [Xanthobacteraceae bacterium]
MKKPRGRPPLDRADRSVSVHLTVTSAQYDALHRAAQTLRRSVPDVIRRALLRTEYSQPRPS